ncbi:MAG: transaldolase [Planctomycetota bacterium]|nr:transaldolase [Planctomycetota bacterium]
MTNTAQLALSGQSIWLDNITRTMLNDGTLARYIRDLNVVGLTSNPTIFDNAVSKGSAYDEQIRELAAQGLSPEASFFELAIADLRRACDLFASVAHRTGGLDGWVSLEVSPKLAYDSESTVKQAIELHRKADRANLFIKVPGTPEGLPAIERLAFEGVPVNVTLLFDFAQYRAAAEAWWTGLERRAASGKCPLVHSVASVFISRWEKPVTPLVKGDLLNQAGIAAGRRCWEEYVSLYSGDRWSRLADQGATPQRLLFASTSTKDPLLSPTMYVEALAAPCTVDTVPEATLLAFASSGMIREVLCANDHRGSEMLARLTSAGVNLDTIALQLQREGAASFVESWTHLISTVEGKMKVLATA